MNTQSNTTVNTVQVNGKEVLDFTPQSTSQSAIVPLSVIQKLASLLHNDSLTNIKREMIEVLDETSVNTMEKYVQILQDEVDFHTTVNLLNMYQPQVDKRVEYAV